MEAVVRRAYGSPEVIRVEEVPRPTPGPGQVLVEVRAAAINPLDWHFMRGEPRAMRLQTGLRAPKDPRMGQDLAGVVVELGEGVTRWKVGDEVLGSCLGALAEYAVAGEGDIAAKPEAMSFAEASGLACAGLTAIQGLRDNAHLSAGQRLLVTGAGGGVGHLAVQLGKAWGAHVTGVCSTRNVDLVLSLGADEVVDYSREDFTQTARPYDVIFDLAATRSHRELRRITTPKGALLVAGASPSRPLRHVLWGVLTAPFVSQHQPTYTARWSGTDLEELSRLVEAGSLRVEVSRTYPLEQAGEAIGHVEEGHARGKVVVEL